MAYTKKNIIMEVVLINLIRITFVGVCLCFFFPMFKTTLTFGGVDKFPVSYMLTGFGAMFGVPNSSVSGNPMTLVAFVFPIIGIMFTLIDFLYKRLHIFIYIFSAVGVILTIAYFITVSFTLNGKSEIFNLTRFSWGCLLMLGAYVIIIGLTFIYSKIAKDD